MEYPCNLVVCFRLDEGISFYVDVKHTINSRDSSYFLYGYGTFNKLVGFFKNAYLRTPSRQPNKLRNKKMPNKPIGLMVLYFYSSNFFNQKSSLTTP
jgi:hypothetical protein